MKKIILPLLLLVNTTYAKTTQVYGTDDRQDIHKVKDLAIKNLAKSTAAMFPKEVIEETEDGYQLADRSLGDSMKMCVGERFNNQPATSKCSGFLIAPNLLMTAGHCLIAEVIPDYILNPPAPRPYRDPMDDPFDFDIDDILNPTEPDPVTTPARKPIDQTTQEFMDSTAQKGCEIRKWVFDYNYVGKNDATKVAKSSVYSCKKVHYVRYSEEHTEDFAIIELDRDVTFSNGEKRTPLQLDIKSKRYSDQSVFMIGHPAGLPSKLTDNARVLKKENKDQLKVVIDSFGGNSGSAIFDQATQKIIGILIRGHNDYYHVDTHETDRFGHKKQCKKVYVCEQEDDKRCNGEIVYNIKSLPSDVKSFIKTIL